MEQLRTVHQVLLVRRRPHCSTVDDGWRLSHGTSVRLEAPHLTAAANRLTLRSVSALIVVRHGTRHQHVGQLLVGVNVLRLDLVVERFFL